MHVDSHTHTQTHIILNYLQRTAFENRCLYFVIMPPYIEIVKSLQDITEDILTSFTIGTSISRHAFA